jgi:hypothetical protein
LRIQHSSFTKATPEEIASKKMKGKNIVTGGSIRISPSGRIQVTNSSGHYNPSLLSAEEAVLELTRRGVDCRLIDVAPYY